MSENKQQRCSAKIFEAVFFVVARLARPDQEASASVSDEKFW